MFIVASKLDINLNGKNRKEKVGKTILNLDQISSIDEVSDSCGKYTRVKMRNGEQKIIEENIDGIISALSQSQRDGTIHSLVHKES